MGAFEGRVVIVTGAGQGIGYAIAKKFAEEGAVVIATGRTFSKVERIANELAPLKVADEATSEVVCSQCCNPPLTLVQFSY